MIKIICRDANGALSFDKPEALLIARRLEEVMTTLRRADEAVSRGRYVAGIVTYEAGAALVPRQAAPRRSALPLVILAVYRAPGTPAATAAGTFRVGPLIPAVAASAYRAGIAHIQAAIREGEVYQVNYAVPFSFAFEGDPLALHRELAGSDYPYDAYAEYGDVAISSCSPELFVRFEPGRIVTKPMKGTASPGDLGTLDNPKNRAEHVMIVDLLRNDLHRISSEVRVEQLMEVEDYPAFSTMTSTIVAERRAGTGLAATFEAMFPCGSITGAPKVTAMAEIARLEGARGAFCGSIGYLAPDGTGTWNVAIRTAQIDRARNSGVLHVGGGVVADSQPAGEWAEILTKRRFFERVAPGFALIETLRLDPDGGYRNLAAHLARLAASADALHFALDEDEVRGALDDVAADARAATGPVLVRLELGSRGAISTTMRRMNAGHLRTEVEVGWASVALDSRDPLLRHKTTWRPFHDAALAEAEERACFDLILCNERGDVCDGARTNVFVGGEPGEPLRTPPLESGALPGILRGQLLASGYAVEATLRPNDVAAAAALYVGNSARGLLVATLLGRTSGLLQKR